MKYLPFLVIIATVFLLSFLGYGVFAPSESSNKIVEADFYVGPDGNDLNKGSSTEPLKTIQKALDLAKPGETVFLLPGVYYQDAYTARSGTETSPIKITGTKDSIVKGGGKDRVFEIRHSYIILDGFAIDGLRGNPDKKEGYQTNLVYAQSLRKNAGVTGIKILNMDFKNAGGECIRLKYFSSKNEIAYNNIENCGRFDFKFGAGGKNGEGIYIGTAPEQLDKNPTKEIDKSNGNFIHHNSINTQGAEGVDIKEGAEENVVEHNKITGEKDIDSGGLDSRGDRNIFRFNEVFGCVGAGIRLGGDNFNGRLYGKGNDVYENKIYGNGYGAIKVQAFPQGKICANEVFENGSKSGDYGYKIDFVAACE